MRGYDPRIHDENQQQKLLGGYRRAPSLIAGSSPAMIAKCDPGINSLPPVLLSRHKLDTPMTRTPP
jgi:hypothetical protein